MADSLSFLANHIVDIALLVVGALYGIGILKNRKDVDTLNDDKKWESALKIRDTTIADLTNALESQKARHQGELSSMQIQIDTLQQQVNVLSNTVSGRDILIELVKEQKIIVSGIDEIKAAMSISRSPISPQ